MADDHLMIVPSKEVFYFCFFLFYFFFSFFFFLFSFFFFFFFFSFFFLSFFFFFLFSFFFLFFSFFFFSLFFILYSLFFFFFLFSFFFFFFSFSFCFLLSCKILQDLDFISLFFIYLTSRTALQSQSCQNPRRPGRLRLRRSPNLFPSFPNPPPIHHLNLNQYTHAQHTGSNVELSLKGIDMSLLHVGAFLCDPENPIRTVRRFGATIQTFDLGQFGVIRPGHEVFFCLAFLFVTQSTILSIFGHCLTLILFFLF